MSFDEFWKVFPRRIAKLAARTAWDRAMRIATPEEVVEGAKNYARWLQEPGWRPHAKHPATWLNAGCWMDELDFKPAFDVEGYKQQMERERKAREDAVRFREELQEQGVRRH